MRAYRLVYVRDVFEQHAVFCEQAGERASERKRVCARLRLCLRLHVGAHACACMHACGGQFMKTHTCASVKITVSVRACMRSCLCLWMHGDARREAHMPLMRD